MKSKTPKLPKKGAVARLRKLHVDRQAAAAEPRFMVWVGHEGGTSVKRGDVFEILGTELMTYKNGYMLKFINRRGTPDAAWEGAFCDVVVYQRLRTKYLQFILPPVNFAFVKGAVKPVAEKREKTTGTKKPKKFAPLTLVQLKASIRGGW